MAKKKSASDNAPSVKATNKKTPVKDEKGFEESLWDSATRLRGNVESSEYKHVVLSLIFLKFVSDKFEERKAALIAESKQAYTDGEFYTPKFVVKLIAVMNLALRGIEADFAPDLRAEYVHAKPPFNDSDWFRKDDDVRWQFDVPRKGNASFACVKHSINHIASQGMAGFVQETR